MYKRVDRLKNYILHLHNPLFFWELKASLDTQYHCTTDRSSDNQGNIETYSLQFLLGFSNCLSGLSWVICCFVKFAAYRKASFSCSIRVLLLPERLAALPNCKNGLSEK